MWKPWYTLHISVLIATKMQVSYLLLSSCKTNACPQLLSIRTAVYRYSFSLWSLLSLTLDSDDSQTAKNILTLNPSNWNILYSTVCQWWYVVMFFARVWTQYLCFVLCDYDTCTKKCMYSTSHWSGLKTNLLSFLICHVTLFLSLFLSFSPTLYNIFIVRVYIFMWVVLFGGGTGLVLMEHVIVCIVY